MTKAPEAFLFAGNYTEQLNVARPGPLTLFGQTEHINNPSTNEVTVLWVSINGLHHGEEYRTTPIQAC
jgi:hypothetical protein